MSLIKYKEQVEHETGVSSYFPITHLCTPNIFETKGRMLGTVLKIEGVPYITATDEELNHYQQLIHQALLKINHEFMLYETKIRRKRKINLNSPIKNDFAKQVNDKYQQRFKNSALYTNEIFLTLVYKNEDKGSGKERLSDKVLSFTKKLSDKHLKSTQSEQRTKAITKLNNKASELVSFLEPMGVRRIEAMPSKQGFCELLSFLSIIPNGGVEQRLAHDMKPSLITKTPKDISKHVNLYPKGQLGPYLCNHRLFFGDSIQFQGNSSNASRYAAMMSLKQYGPQTANVILDPLLNIDGEFVLTQSFAPVESDLAVKDIQRARNIKISAEDLASSQINDLEELADIVASDKVHCGFHHNSLMLLSENQAELDRLVNEASKAYALSNMSIVRETLGQIPCFFAQIPGNTHFITRSALITSENFADFCSLHNSQTGHNGNNFLGQPVSLLETSSKTPVYFNYHVEGSKTNPSRGHALVIGGNDSGKTTTVSFLDCQMMRYKKHRSIFIDRNNGLKIYVQALGGKYITVSPTHKSQCKMNPLQLDDTEHNRDFCKNWFASLLLKENESSLPSHILEVTNDAIDYCFDILKPELRSLTNLSQSLPVDFERWGELRRWLRATDDKVAGQYGWLFDNNEDVIHLDSNRIGFDITYILDNFSPELATPLFMYIMHRIELSLDGNPTSIVVDEMWQVLRAPFWKSWLEERLPSIRKEAGHIIGMTQSPRTIVESSISAELLDNVATLILFPNPKADESIYVKQLGLGHAEFEFIKNNSPQSRLFLYKHDTQSTVCRLDLSDLKDEIRVFSGNKSSVALMDEITKRNGLAPENWLNEFIDRSDT